VSGYASPVLPCDLAYSGDRGQCLHVRGDRDLRLGALTTLKSGKWHDFIDQNEKVLAKSRGPDQNKTMINWLYFPKSRHPSMLATAIIEAFEAEAEKISSRNHDLRSNQVLACVEPHLTQVGFLVEGGTKTEGPVLIPVMFGRDGRPVKHFHADAFHEGEGFVVEVEAGRAIKHNQFLKDLFQACLMHNAHYVAIALRKHNDGENDFEEVGQFMEILSASTRLKLPLKGVLLIGY
jgi:hypothetical protein